MFPSAGLLTALKNISIIDQEAVIKTVCGRDA
jgi:hypothetical protein